MWTQGRKEASSNQLPEFAVMSIVSDKQTAPPTFAGGAVERSEVWT